MKSKSTIFDYLEEVRKRPTMYFESLSDLQSQIWGYYAALGNHKIIEPVPTMTHHFLKWVRFRTTWSTSLGWAKAIELHVAKPQEQIAKFFELVDEYKQLRPKTLGVVHLKARHNPTGKRVTVGLKKRIEKPKKLEVIRYAPAPLHFLRFHYKERIHDAWLLSNSQSSERTTLSDAKRWVRDEFQVEFHEWQQAK